MAQPTVPILKIGEATDGDTEGARSVQVSPSAARTPPDENDEPSEARAIRPGLLSRLSAENAIPMSIYRGSYIKSNTSIVGLNRLDGGKGSSSQLRPPLHGHRYTEPTPGDARSKIVHKLDNVFSSDTEVRDNYDLEELRDGFFDAIFIPSTFIETTSKLAIEQSQLLEQQQLDKDVRPNGYLKRTQAYIFDVARRVFERYNSHMLIRAFAGYLIAYVLCLISATRDWLGNQAYFMPIAALLHHAGRSVGSQVEITVESIVGAALGMGWSSLALFVSTSTAAASRGYGGINAAALVLALFVTSWFRAHYIRLYHASLSCTMAMLFMGTSRVYSQEVYWRKAFDFGIPYVLGLSIALLCSLLIFPNTGHSAVLISLKDLLSACETSVRQCGGRGFTGTDRERNDLRTKHLTTASLEFSRVFREMSNEFTLSVLTTVQVLQIRNVLQAAVTRLRTIPSPAQLFEPMDEKAEDDDFERMRAVLRTKFAESAQDLVFSMSAAFVECGKYVEYMLHGDRNLKAELALSQTLEALDRSMNDLSKTYRSSTKHMSILFRTDYTAEIYDIMLYIHYLYQASKSTRTLLHHIYQLESTYDRKWKISRPCYPFRRALFRTTARITHDRGGQSAAYYFQSANDVTSSFQEVERINKELALRSGRHKESEKIEDAHGARYKVWQFMHLMQGYETRFALKAAITLTLVSLPGWLTVSRGWYTTYDSWFAALLAALTLHPRVGGNARDFLTRSLFCISGALWGGIVNATHNRVAVGVLGMGFMIPCLYRWLMTPHPRSGLIACFSFTLVSLSVNMDNDEISIWKVMWTRMAAMEAGLACAVVISWIFWPFVARHQVRKSLAVALAQISQCYQIVADRYLYKDEDDTISILSLQLAEVREARMIQSLASLEELIEMTGHEPSLRGNFDPGPYSAMIHSCQYVFQRIVDARVSSIYFNVYDSDASKLVTKQLQSLRRDATASAVFTFYLLSNSFRSKHKVPKFIPSAIMARKLLFDSVAKLAQITHDTKGGNAEADAADLDDEQVAQGNHEEQVWQLIHEAAFSRAFTDITEELERMIAYSKHILGEDRI